MVLESEGRNWLGFVQVGCDLSFIVFGFFCYEFAIVNDSDVLIWARTCCGLNYLDPKP